MNFAVIIPDHGGRDKLIDFAYQQIAKQTVQPEKVYHINFKPENEEPDLKKRLHIGVNMAKADGIDWVFVIEDDMYPQNYFALFKPYFEQYDFIGQATTIYYHIFNRVWKEQNHPHRSSLFTTAFKVSALNNFEWEKARNLFIDLDLWQYARHKRKRFIQTGAIGMKHSIGRCAGIGHQMTKGNKDPHLKWLQQHVDEHAFEFYKSLTA